LGEISEDYDSAMIAAYLAQREATLRGLLQGAQQIPGLDEPCDPGLWAPIAFQGVRRLGSPLP
jgi:hypothetical protein